MKLEFQLVPSSFPRSTATTSTRMRYDHASGRCRRKKLPIGIQTFAKIREGGGAHYYVDKTPHILRLLDQGSHSSELAAPLRQRACCSTPSPSCSRAGASSFRACTPSSTGTGRSVSRCCGSAFPRASCATAPSSISASAAAARELREPGAGTARGAGHLRAVHAADPAR